MKAVILPFLAILVYAKKKLFWLFTKSMLYTVMFRSSWSALLTSSVLLLNIQSHFTISQAITFHNYSCVNLCMFSLLSVYSLMHSSYSLAVYPTRVLSFTSCFSALRAITGFQFKLLLHCILKGILLVVLTNIDKRTQILQVSTVKFSLTWALWWFLKQYLNILRRETYRITSVRHLHLGPCKNFHQLIFIYLEIMNHPLVT